MGEDFSRQQREIHLGRPSGMLGKCHTDQFKKDQSKRTRQRNLLRDPEVYQKVSQTAQGNKMMFKGQECHRFHPEEFEQKLQEGWKFGGLSRKGKYKNRQRKSSTDKIQ